MQYIYLDTYFFVSKVHCIKNLDIHMCCKLNKLKKLPDSKADYGTNLFSLSEKHPEIISQ